jgi:hypothetical protein
MGPDIDAYNCVVVSMVELNCRRYPMLKRDLYQEIRTSALVFIVLKWSRMRCEDFVGIIIRTQDIKMRCRIHDPNMHQKKARTSSQGGPSTIRYA